MRLRRTAFFVLPIQRNIKQALILAFEPSLCSPNYSTPPKETKYQVSQWPTPRSSLATQVRETRYSFLSRFYSTSIAHAALQSTYTFSKSSRCQAISLTRSIDCSRYDDVNCFCTFLLSPHPFGARAPTSFMLSTIYFPPQGCALAIKLPDGPELQLVLLFQNFSRILRLTYACSLLAMGVRPSRSHRRRSQAR